MRCFLLLTAILGGKPQLPHVPIYVNRDLITVVTPAAAMQGSEFDGARTHLSFNSSTYRWVVETPDEVMRKPCVAGTGPREPD